MTRCKECLSESCSLLYCHSLRSSIAATERLLSAQNSTLPSAHGPETAGTRDGARQWPQWPVWQWEFGNAMFTTNTKMKIYQTCVLSILLYHGPSTPTRNAFYLCCFRRPLGITWHYVTHRDVCAGLMDTSQNICCLRHCLPIDTRPTGTFTICVYKYICWSWKINAGVTWPVASAAHVG